MGTLAQIVPSDIAMASSVSFMDDHRRPSSERFEEPKVRYQPRAERYGGRSLSTGRYDSDRSIEERYSRGCDGDSLTISDFFKYGRGGRAYERPEGFRRPPSARSQSLGRLDAERYLDDRYGPRYFEDNQYSFERFPRDYYDDRYMRDLYEERMARDIERFGRPIDDRFFYDRYGPDRPMSERFREERYPLERHPFERPVAAVAERMPERMSDRMPERMSDRMPERMSDRMPERMSDRMPERMSDRMPERYFDRFDGTDRHDRDRRYANDRTPTTDQRFANDRERYERERFAAERHDRHTNYEKYGNSRQSQEKYGAGDRRSTDRQSSDKQNTDRYGGEKDKRSSDKAVSDRYRTDQQNAERDEKFTNDRASTERGSTSGERFPKFQ